MSVRAYIKEFKDVKVEKIDGQMKIIETSIRDTTPLFNVWNQDVIFEIFTVFGFDRTNVDSIGEIELTSEDWDKWKENYYPCHKNLYERKDILEVLQKIEDYFELGHEYLTCTCY